MKTYSVRFEPGQDLKEALKTFTTANGIQAGSIITSVGALSKARLRMAGAQEIKEFEGPFEIVSLVGTLSPEKCHLHISLSDKEGRVIGGHMKEGCIISITGETTILEDTQYLFTRKHDERTGYDELEIKPRI